MEIQKLFKEFCEWLASASDEELEAAIKEARANCFFKDEREEIIHCKECEYFNPLYGSCYLVMGTNGENFYCAAGKRRKPEDE